MSKNKIPLSVIIHTKNSEQTLQQCLDSVQFAKEIIVIDMHSSDETTQIAQNKGAIVISVEDKEYGYADPVRNFGLRQATQDRILVVDSDEVVSPGLADWITTFIDQPDNATAAFRVPRRNMIFGQEIQHTGWWPDYQIRFFKKGSVKWPSEVHGIPIVKGDLKDLPADRELALIHQNYPTVEQFVERMNRYTTATAKEKSQSATSAKPSEAVFIESFSQEFNRRLFQWQGYKDGGVGIALSILQSTYELLVALKIQEQKGFSKKHHPEITIQSLTNFSKELSYWIADWHVQHSTGVQKFIWRVKRKFVK